MPFLLLPVSHQENLVQRLPWVTLATIAVCIGVQVWTSTVEEGCLEELAALEGEAKRIEIEAVGTQIQRVVHSLDGASSRQVLADVTGEAVDEVTALDPQAATEHLQKAFVAGKLSPERTRYEAYQKLKAQAEQVAARLPTLAFGFVPSEGGIARMITSLFVHGGWLHVIANMWFLYLVGCALEDRWGPLSFLVFYGLSGVVACLAFQRVHPDSSVPLVGASGAIAGAMGAFGVCFARTRVRMFYFYLLFTIPRWGSFNASAIVLVILWVAVQGLWTWLETTGFGDGVAYSAHAGGVAYGLMVGIAMRLSGTDRVLRKAQEAEDWSGGWQEDPRLLSAMALRQEGRYDQAVAALMELVRSRPDHEAARHELLAIALHPSHGGERHSTSATLGERARLTALDMSVPWLLAHDRAAHDAVALRETYRSLRRSAPNYGLTDQELGWLVAAGMRLSDVTLAVDAAAELLTQFPGSPLLPRALWTVAELQGDAGRRALQRGTLQEILERFPDDEAGELARKALLSQRPGAEMP